MKWFGGITGILILAGLLAWFWHEPNPDETEIGVVAAQPGVSNSTVDANTLDKILNPSQNDEVIPDQVQDTPTYLQQIQNYLQRGNYPAAVEVYNQAYNISDESKSEELGAAILSHARALLRAKEFEHSETLLLAYLAAFYRDVDALLLLADSYHHQKKLSAELDTLFKIYDFAYQTKTLDRVKRRIRKISKKYRRQLREEENFAAIVELYQSLIDKFPNNGKYYIDLARQHIANKELEEAKQVLTRVLTDPTVGRKAEKLLTKIEQQQSAESGDKILVPLTRLNSNHYAVRAIINGRTTISLLIDTGASMSVIRPRALKRAGRSATDIVRYISLNTANGITDAPVVVLQNMIIGGQTVSNIKVAALDLQGLTHVDGLLGMDFLGHFEFVIHQSNNQLQLSKPN